MAKKRAPGAGMPPRGDFVGNTAMLNVRIRPDTKAELAALAERHGRSTSQELQSAIADWARTFNQSRIHIAALAEAVTTVAEETERITKQRWTDDAFTGAALAQAINIVVQRYIPHSLLEEPTPPPDMSLNVQTPDEVANFVSQALLMGPGSRLKDNEYSKFRRYLREVLDKGRIPP